MSQGFDPYGDLFRVLGMASDVSDPLGPSSASESSCFPDPGRLSEIRRKLVWAFSWAVPSREAVAAIAAHSPLIEVGAGTGYWAWLLRQEGADVLAVDRIVGAPPSWSAVAEGGPQFVTLCPERTLLLCWPPMGESLAADCLDRYKGDVFLSIGEKGESACTGDPVFRALLQERFVEEREIALPCWPGYADCLTIYRRRC